MLFALYNLIIIIIARIDSLRATASLSASSPFSKGRHTSMIVALVGSSIMISEHTVDPLSFTV